VALERGAVDLGHGLEAAGQGQHARDLEGGDRLAGQPRAERAGGDAARHRVEVEDAHGARRRGAGAAASPRTLSAAASTADSRR